MTLRLCGFLVVVLIAAVGERTLAADNGSGAYVGANFGRARSGYDTNSIDAALAGEAAAVDYTLELTKRSTSRLSDAWGVDFGYFLNPYVGLEAAFLHIGELRYIAVATATSSTVSESVLSTTEVTSHGPALSLVFRLPLSESFEADLRVGDYFGKATFDNDTIVKAEQDFMALSKSRSGLLASMGGAYTFAGHYSIRLDYLRIQQTGDGSAGGKFSVNLVTAGLSYSF